MVLNSLFRLFAYAISCFIACTTVQAATIVSVGGGDGTSGLNFGPTSTFEVAATEFTTTQSYSDASIFGDFQCISCIGDVSLYREIGSSAGPADFVAGYAFDTPNGDNFGSFSSEFQIFSGLSLVADTYFMVVGLTSGTLGWRTATTPALTENDGASVNPFFDFGSKTRASSGSHLSTFEALLNSTNRLQFRVDATISAPPQPPSVPLPASGLLLFVSLAGFRVLGSRRS